MTDTTKDTFTFEFTGSRVRMFVIDGAPWFLAADVRRVPGVSQSGSNFTRLGPDEVRCIPRGLASGKGMGTASLLSESGLYKFALRSDKGEAAALQEWVTREVLPAIRKTGGYRLQGVAPEAVAEGTVAEMPDVGGVMQQMATLRGSRRAQEKHHEHAPHDPPDCRRGAADDEQLGNRGADREAPRQRDGGHPQDAG